MSSARGGSPLVYRRLGRAEIGVIAQLDLDPDHVARFLGPVADIVQAVRHGPAHSAVALHAGGAFVGFFVVHPSPRDQSCWWLGWLAVSQANQGHGYGSAAMAAVLHQLRHIAGCRRIRLLVAADNLRARAVYDRAGFRPVGRAPATGELVLELLLPSLVSLGELATLALSAVAARARRVFRHRRLRRTAGPHAAWVIGVERGPPALSRRAPQSRQHRPGQGHQTETRQSRRSHLVHQGQYAAGQLAA